MVAIHRAKPPLGQRRTQRVLLVSAPLLLLATARIRPAAAAFCPSSNGFIGSGGDGGGSSRGGTGRSALPDDVGAPPTISPSGAPDLGYGSRSTADPDATSSFAAGSEGRRRRLNSALADLGIVIDPPPAPTTLRPPDRGDAAADLNRSGDATSDTFFDASSDDAGEDFKRCTPALRMYNSFILPKSEGALATAELPQRAAVIANGIAFQLREYRSHQAEWVRNHDWSLREAEVAFRSSAADGKAEEGREAMAAATGVEAEADMLCKGTRHPLTLILDNIRSAHNVGNILRLAEAARAAEVVLCGMTPGPPNPKVLKTAVGSAEYVPQRHIGSTLEAVRKLKGRGVKVWGVETTERSQVVWRTDMPQPLALVFGNELVGVDARVLEECDELVCLPTHGVKNSLNVATCAAVVVWEALRQWDDDDA